MTHVSPTRRGSTRKTFVPTVPAATGAARLRPLPRAQRGHLEQARRRRRERFDHLYSDDELREWVEPLRELAGEAEDAYASSTTTTAAPATPATAATSSRRRRPTRIGSARSSGKPGCRSASETAPMSGRIDAVRAAARAVQAARVP